MTPAETAAFLRRYNEWRRDDEDISQFDVCEIGEAIDAAVEMIERLEAAESDALEQARLNGMGASREAALMAKLEAAEKDIALKERVIDSLGVILTAVVNERDELRATMEKIADWYGAWGPYPETNKSWCAMAIVTAREAVKPLTNLCAKGEGK